MGWFQIDLYSACLKRTVQVQVLVPVNAADCQADLTAKGKALYLLHGYGDDNSAYLLEYPVKDLSEKYGITIVIPSGNNDFYLNRPDCRVYAEDFIAKELPEKMEALFPCLSDRAEDRIVGGLSMGAYGALRLGLKYPDRFGHAIVNSTSLTTFLKNSAYEAENAADKKNRFGIVKGFYEQLWPGLDEMEKTEGNPAILADQLTPAQKKSLDLYISVGYNDLLCSELREMIRYFRKNDISVTYEEFPGTHEQKVFSKALARGLEHVLGRASEEDNSFWVEGKLCKELVSQ